MSGANHFAATKDNYLASISRMERALVWRRTNRFDDVEQVAKEIDREVSRVRPDMNTI
jgi:hypothetical protein